MGGWLDPLEGLLGQIGEAASGWMGFGGGDDNARGIESWPVDPYRSFEVDPYSIQAGGTAPSQVPMVVGGGTAPALLDQPGMGGLARGARGVLAGMKLGSKLDPPKAPFVPHPNIQTGKVDLAGLAAYRPQLAAPYNWGNWR